MSVVEIQVDVSDAADLGEPAEVALTVTLPASESLPERPVVCFAKPGGGYSQRYFTESLPGPVEGAQADWHADRGWIFVSVDHLGTGASSIHHDTMALDFATVSAANHAAETEVLRRLAEGSLHADLPPVPDPLRIGIGQSMGGCLTIVQQARHRSYDGIGVLGYSAVHTHPPVAPGAPPFHISWVGRDTLLGERMVILNEHPVLGPDTAAGGEEWEAMAWGFHYDDIDRQVVAEDMDRGGVVPPWGSASLPFGVACAVLTPGIIAPEAAAITVPVLVGMGERDVLTDPRAELRAYRSATSVDWFECPRMGHMHNFASTRELLWRRIEAWAAWVNSDVRRSTPR